MSEGEPISVDPPRARLSTCRNGIVTVQDVARAAGVSVKAAVRALRADDRCARLGTGSDQLIAVESRLLSDLSNLTVKEAARAVATQLGLGRMGAHQRARERAALDAALPKEKVDVSAQSHPWKLGLRGRFVRAVENGAHIATLRCGADGCLVKQDIRFRALAGGDEMDRKFEQKGWRLDPPRCPDHQQKRRPATMTSVPTKAAMQAQVKVFALLTEHFDAEAGTFAQDWDDARVARETGMAVDLVRTYREEGFGPLKEPPEIAAVLADVAALRTLLDETIAPIRSELVSLETRVRDLRKRFAA